MLAFSYGRGAIQRAYWVQAAPMSSSSAASSARVQKVRVASIA
jgi:hypothetical protein